MDKVLSNAWHPVGLAASLTEEIPLAATILGEEVVVWRSRDRICAFRDLCVHRGVRLSMGRVCNDRIRCAYHGWEYDAGGQCVFVPAHPDLKMPAKARATAVYRAVEHRGLIWVNLGDADAPLPDLPHLQQSGYRVIPCGPYIINASAPRVVENFLDLSHPPILHDGYLGTADRAAMHDYTLEDRDGAFFVRDVRYFQPDPDGSGEGRDVSYDFGILAPLTVYFVKHIDSPEGQSKFVLVFAVRPESESRSHAHFIAAYNYATDLSDDQIRDFHGLIINQDKPILESQRPELLPMDLSQELHLRSDAVTARYRRHLKELGLTFGVA